MKKRQQDVWSQLNSTISSFSSQRLAHETPSRWVEISVAPLWFAMVSGGIMRDYIFFGGVGFSYISKIMTGWWSTYPSVNMSQWEG